MIKLSDICNNPVVAIDESEFQVISWTSRIRRTRPWKKRKAKANKLIVHHTAGNYKPFPLGMERSVEYCINHKGWPTIPYHYYVPHEMVTSDDGRPCIFLLNSTNKHTYHTYGGNTRGIGLVFQGDFGYTESGEQPSVYQQEYAVEIASALIHHHDIDETNVLGHYNFTKKACPGYFLEGMCEAFQGSYGCMYGP